jgi:hypothetical protein
MRREYLNHIVVLGERDLRRIPTAYFAYYHRARTHSLDKDAPAGRPIETAGARDDHPDSRDRWSASSLRSAGGVVQPPTGRASLRTLFCSVLNSASSVLP